MSGLDSALPWLFNVIVPDIDILPEYAVKHFPPPAQVVAPLSILQPSQYSSPVLRGTEYKPADALSVSEPISSSCLWLAPLTETLIWVPVLFVPWLWDLLQLSCLLKLLD